jgi:hypothetical protein
MSFDQCIVNKLDGKRCSRKAKAGTDRCYQHPVGTEERREQYKAAREIAITESLLNGFVCQ